MTDVQPAPQRKRRKGLWIFLGLVMVAGCIGGVAAVSGGKSTSDNTATTKDNPIAATSAASPTHAPDPNSISGDGTFAVGSQVKPGTYRAVVPHDGMGCYYARLKDASGGVDSIISNNTGAADSQQIVEISSTDKFFETEGCGTWTKVG